MGEHAGQKRAATEMRSKDVIVLFDVDGTLTKPRNKVTQDMLETLALLREKVYVGMVGGSDLSKQLEQLGENVLDLFDYTFSENGLVGFKERELINETSMADFLGEEKLQKLINYILKYFSELTLPVKRGTFIEFRKGMLNVSPIGRNCSQAERDEYERYDLEHGIRKSMVEALKKEFAEMDLVYSIGGQISFDVFPRGWDKTYCLRFLDDFKTIHFFGDKTFAGGNDHEIYESERTVGHSVKTYEDTIRECKALFLDQ
ncbi:Phosphomannomutase [Porphyridium purpureum]|uniref:Phosphomannomutase n=1 Tax=Porphyridium purpureum TaxID=35688 RepID=A0A5J4Z1L6_PORPP|nr:Phosphomannomutase [Porphyridium purpureum]|eukprot:POR7125..scf295_1